MIRAEVIVPIVLPTEKCVKVPLPDNYVFVMDDAAPNNDVVGLDPALNGVAQLVIHYSFDVGIKIGCDPLYTPELVQPSGFVIVPFYVLPTVSAQPTRLRLLGTGKCDGVAYNIYSEP